MKQNYELRGEARKALYGKWGMMIIATVIYGVVVGAVGYFAEAKSPLVYTLLSILVVAPMMYGLYTLALDVFRGEAADIGGLFQGFRGNYVHVVLTLLLSGIYIFLWSLLLLIPGIVKSYSYAMVPYILKDHPEMCYDKAIDASMHIMQGHKMKLFMLDLSFIGWILLCIITLGLGFIVLAPYMSVARAAFYEDVKTRW